MNSLKSLFVTAGQAPWLDYLRHDLVENGTLANLIANDGLRGLTSNPSIFEKSIGHDQYYVGAIERIQAGGDHGVSALYEELAVADIRAAADVLRAVYTESLRADGYVSLEVSPYLAHDTTKTVAEADRLWRSVDRPNLMVKVPATEAGIPAIRQLIGRGININVTLLFSISAYERVVEAYISGLEDLLASDGNPAQVASVASFFVSRIDTAVEHALKARGGAAPKLEARIAIANAKLAYARSKALFAGPRWQRLAAAGARRQRLLWASTGTKNPALPDTIYVEQLVARDTVNTMPPATMDAFRDHGQVVPDSAEQDLDVAAANLDALAGVGISLDQITQDLVDDGVRQFADAFDGVLGAVARVRRQLAEGEVEALAVDAGSPAFADAYGKELEQWRRTGSIRALWAANAALWTGGDEGKWLGWLNVIDQELGGIAELQAFTGEVRARGTTDVVLLGMGGSSLGAEVLGAMLDPAGGTRVHVLDSTDPAQIAAVETAIDFASTLFIVSSKSGTTLEPCALLAYFLERARQYAGADAGRNFVAITDPDSALEKQARDLKFWRVFHGIPDIGGRFSVLSKFGLVLAAAIGIDVANLLRTAQPMVRSCAEDVPPAENPGIRLGVALGVAARDFHRDKITIVTSPGIATLGAWLEQLLAESTGKQGKGLVPVDGEKLTTPEHYGADRVFIAIDLAAEADKARRATLNALAKAGHPVIRITLPDAWHVGGEFFRWEIAVAVAGAVIGIDPFDQPEIDASKLWTRARMEQAAQQGGTPGEAPVISENGLALYAAPDDAEACGRHNSAAGCLRAHLARARSGVNYVALLAYLPRTREHAQQLQGLQAIIRDGTAAATCAGFGPRFLHATGQTYKGGPPTGVFLQVTCDDPSDIAVPGQRYSFGMVKQAQARGDLEMLRSRGRPALHVHLRDADGGLPALTEAVKLALRSNGQPDRGPR